MDRSRTDYYFFHKVNAPSFAVLTFAPIFWHQLGAKVEAPLYLDDSEVLSFSFFIAW